MCLTAVATIGAGLVGGYMQSNAAKDATRAQTRANQQALGIQRDQFNQTSANFAPYRNQGLQGFNALNYEMGLGSRPDGYSGFEQSPGFQYAVDQGQRAIEGSAAASGNVLSGATLKSLQGQRMGLAQQDYGNHLQRLGGIANMGQAAAGNQAAAGSNFATGATNALSNIGNAQAAGAVAQGNAFNTGINNALGGYMMAQTMGGSGGLFGGNSWG